ncbi:hypothetical protein LEUCIP111803_02040 [Leucobacter soli]|uniref:Uncharacterized protein n=1 Tax=Leucobacter soli TaxID=2812850 RepID=A0A916K096_9MICO|nr:hypothetical protein LEUCIP111803_02040 [Leucobacter soli]
MIAHTLRPARRGRAAPGGRKTPGNLRGISRSARNLAVCGVWTDAGDQAKPRGMT